MSNEFGLKIRKISLLFFFLIGGNQEKNTEKQKSKH